MVKIAVERNLNKQSGTQPMLSLSVQTQMKQSVPKKNGSPLKSSWRRFPTKCQVVQVGSSSISSFFAHNTCPQIPELKSVGTSPLRVGRTTEQQPPVCAAAASAAAAAVPLRRGGRRVGSQPAPSSDDTNRQRGR